MVEFDSSVLGCVFGGVLEDVGLVAVYPHSADEINLLHASLDVLNDGLRRFVHSWYVSKSYVLLCEAVQIRPELCIVPREY